MRQDHHHSVNNMGDHIYPIGNQIEQVKSFERFYNQIRKQLGMKHPKENDPELTIGLEVVTGTNVVIGVTGVLVVATGFSVVVSFY